jgi:molecular chaperone DnaK
MANQNKSLGRFHLDGIPPSPRGIPQIEVTFDIDANGILNVSAKDKATGKSQQIRIEASSGLSEEEIKRMKAEAEANADADRKQKEEIDKLNHADSMIFQTEKQLKEYGDKLPADKKGEIESLLSQLKTAHAAKDIAGIDTAMAKMNEIWQQASQQMYQNAGANGAPDPFANAPDGGPFGGTTPNDNTPPPNNNEGNVEDADFEEVK